MNKLLPILVAIAMLTTIAPMVLAEEAYEGIPNVPKQPCAWDLIDCTPDIETSATISGGSGDDPSGNNHPPIIKCKWEYDETVMVDLANCPTCSIPSGCHTAGYWEHDACPCIPGLQVKPVLYGSVTVGFFAVVTDPEGVDHVDHVYADVWHPDKTFKYQIELFPVGFGADGYDKTVALDIWDHAWKCHSDLIKISDFDVTHPGLTRPQDIREEINQFEAYLYYATAEISYCQPGGWYYVGVRAHDGFDQYCDYLYNRFWYIPTAGLAVDFTKVDYGTVAENSLKWAGGDEIFDGTVGKPTARNIGNTPLMLFVGQDDMQFGQTAGNWNVWYDVRLTADGPIRQYDPYEYDLICPPSEGGIDEEGNRYPGVRIPGILPLCTEEKIDFSIHVNKGFPGETYTGIMKLCGIIDLKSYIWQTPSLFHENAPLGVPSVFPLAGDDL